MTQSDQNYVTQTNMNQASGNLPVFDTMDIFDLLGLGNLPPDQKSHVILGITKEAIIRAIDLLMENPSISNEIKVKFASIVDTETDPVKLQERLVELYPSLVNDVVEETQKLKMEMCLRQMKDIRNDFVNGLSSERTMEFSALVENAQKMNDLNDRFGFYENWLKYIEFKKTL